jgi:hypothetical protein
MDSDNECNVCDLCCVVRVRVRACVGVLVLQLKLYAKDAWALHFFFQFVLSRTIACLQIILVYFGSSRDEFYICLVVGASTEMATFTRGLARRTQNLISPVKTDSLERKDSTI